MKDSTTQPPTLRLIGQRVMIYQGDEREGAATIQAVEIEPSLLEVLEDGSKVFTAYCVVVFENDTEESYFRWIRSDNLMVQS